MELNVDVWDEITCLELTHRCNWTCDYCIYGVEKVGKGVGNDFNEIKENIEKIKKLVGDVNISGGEPGLYSESKMDFIFDAFKGRIQTVFTNGEFIRKRYDVRYEGQFKKIVYHCVENLTDEIKYKNIENCIYSVAITHHNIKGLSNFLDTNKDIDFHISYCNYINSVSDDQWLTKDDYIHILKLKRVFKNISNSPEDVMMHVLKGDEVERKRYTEINKEI
jgi:sulfatase maturation enzyme AslB (radical SAM superfamily)